MAEDSAQEAAAGIIDDLYPMDDPAEGPEDQVVEGEQQQEEEDDLIPEIAWETPEELKDILDAPEYEDDDDDDDDEPEQVPELDDEYDDPEKQRLAKRLAKMQKQLKWEKDQKIKASRKNWEAEARKYYQFSNPEVIQATSRRAFLKQAEAQHMAVAKVAKPVFDRLAKEREKMKEQAMAEARAEAEQRWGRPTTGPSAPVNQSNTQGNRRERLESSKGLKDVLKAKLNSGEVKL